MHDEDWAAKLNAYDFKGLPTQAALKHTGDLKTLKEHLAEKAGMPAVYVADGPTSGEVLAEIEKKAEQVHGTAGEIAKHYMEAAGFLAKSHVEEPPKVEPLISAQDPYAYDCDHLTWKVKQSFAVASPLAQMKATGVGVPVTYTAVAPVTPPIELDGRCAAWADAARRSVE